MVFGDRLHSAEDTRCSAARGRVQVTNSGDCLPGDPFNAARPVPQAEVPDISRARRLAFRAESLYDFPMIKILEDAIDKVRRLPADRQAYAAEVLEQIAAAGGGLFVVPEGHRAALREGLEQAERGELVSDDDMTALWKKCGL